MQAGSRDSPTSIMDNAMEQSQCDMSADNEAVTISITDMTASKFFSQVFCVEGDDKSS